MTDKDRKQLIREYKERKREMGVFRVLNTEANRSFVGFSGDLPAMLNRQRAQLRFGGHPHRELQADWNRLGEDAFRFEVLDTLTPSEEPGWDPGPDLRVLEEIWRERLGPAELYNPGRPAPSQDG